MENIEHYKQLVKDKKYNPYLVSSLKVYTILFQEQIKQNQLLLLSFTNLVEYLANQQKQTGVVSRAETTYKTTNQRIN